MNNKFLSETRRGLLASCLVIITGLMFPFGLLLLSYDAFTELVLIGLSYLGFLIGNILLFTGGSKSYILKQVITLLGIVGSAVTIGLVLFPFYFIKNF
jgi:hypothetical protein